MSEEQKPLLYPQVTSVDPHLVGTQTNTGHSSPPILNVEGSGISLLFSYILLTLYLHLFAQEIQHFSERRPFIRFVRHAKIRS